MVTGAVGAPYLLWLLATTNSKERRMTARLRAEGLTLGYDERDVVKALDVDILDGRVTAIVGANACGKSTLLRGLARLLKPRRRRGAARRRPRRPS